ncbi:MAG: hypothetical protein GYA77_08815 [Candidatus Cloacimonetes bacterium]|nr:hypothetical protein [Candidatus Cloacimonadota bacterium]
MRKARHLWMRGHTEHSDGVICRCRLSSQVRNRDFFIAALFSEILSAVKQRLTYAPAPVLTRLQAKIRLDNLPRPSFMTLTRAGIAQLVEH